MLPWLYRAVPIGLTTLFLLILHINVIWSFGLIAGASAQMNESQSLEYTHNKIDSVKPNVTNNITTEQQQSFRAQYGVSLNAFIDVMFTVVHNGIDFGYYNPFASKLLVQYYIPIIAPTVSFGLVKYPRIKTTVQRILNQ